MKKLLNTLYVTSENSYLGLDGENIVVFEEDKEKGRLPLHNLELQEELVCVKWRSNVQIMEEGCKILYLSVFWIALKVLL